MSLNDFNFNWLNSSQLNTWIHETWQQLHSSPAVWIEQNNLNLYNYLEERFSFQMAPEGDPQLLYPCIDGHFIRLGQMPERGIVTFTKGSLHLEVSYNYITVKSEEENATDQNSGPKFFYIDPKNIFDGQYLHLEEKPPEGSPDYDLLSICYP